MSMPTTTIAEDTVAPRRSNALLAGLRAVFLRVGVLPFFLVATLIAFSLVSKEFLALQNLTNVARQSVYLILVSLGQMLALVTGGFDLSVGTAIALTSVVSALAMVTLSHMLSPDMLWLVI
ncbi:MAG: ABC transporter permease, partial [Bradyrhizobium sp.]|nr:ABC transporter permease [Bradyrhizobium sp.]